MNEEYTKELIESKVQVLKNNESYRINDICKFNKNHFACRDIMSKDIYNGTILKKFLTRHDNRNKHQWMYDIMIEQLDLNNYKKYGDDCLLVHIRAGDNFMASGLGNKQLNKNVENNINNYINSHNEIKKIVIVTAFHYGNSDQPDRLYKRVNKYVYREKNKDDNVNELYDFIKKMKLPVEIKSSKDVDEDFCLLSTAKHLITSGGGFSYIIRIMNNKYYNKNNTPNPNNNRNNNNQNNNVNKNKRNKFDCIKNNENIYLSTGNITRHKNKYPFKYLSPNLNDNNHIHHNIIEKIDLPDNKVDIFLSEEFIHKIPFNFIENIINEIYRLLKPNGLFRLSLPDYRCDILDNRVLKDNNGNILFDKGGGGRYHNNKIIGGTLWFPKYEKVKELLEKTNFENEKITFLHYYDENNNKIMNNIDYSLGIISRTPDFDNRVKNPRRPMSIVVDCRK